MRSSDIRKNVGHLLSNNLWQLAFLIKIRPKEPTGLAKLKLNNEKSHVYIHARVMNTIKLKHVQLKAGKILIFNILIFSGCLLFRPFLFYEKNVSKCNFMLL